MQASKFTGSSNCHRKWKDIISSERVRPEMVRMKVHMCDNTTITVYLPMD